MVRPPTPHGGAPLRSWYPAPRLFVVAVMFLTRIPVPDVGHREDDLRRAAAFFPLVGAVVAAVGIAVRAGGGWVWDPVVGTVLGVAATVIVTGAFHEDGLADTADGVWGGSTPARRLEIMRDSRLGTYGVVALVTALALRVALLAPLPLDRWWRVVLAAHVLGRASTLLALRVAPALPGSSGAEVAPGPGRWGTVLGAVTAVVAAGVGLGPVAAGPALLLAVVATVVAARYLSRRLGGMVGDALGAVNQFVLILVLAYGAAAYQGVT